MELKIPYLKIIGILIAIIGVLWLLSSGWKINPTKIGIGPIELEFQSPTPITTPIIAPIQTTPVVLNTPMPSNHVPVITMVKEREEYSGGELKIHKDIYFSDSTGDAYLVVYEVLSTDISGISVENDPINAFPEEQKTGTFVTGTWRCGNKHGNYTVVLKARILDTAGFQSQPQNIVFKCH